MLICLSGCVFPPCEQPVNRKGRVRETIEVVSSNGGIVAAVGMLADRCGTTPDFGCPLFRLLKLQVEIFEPDKLPPDLVEPPPNPAASSR